MRCLRVETFFDPHWYSQAQFPKKIVIVERASETTMRGVEGN